ncbi:Uncharacterised protein [Mycobacteroides abscessus subsp. massiliense]|nr:Uncharacterised protein [Mycobacteroides abscessus subsp. massiliense]
MHDGERQRRGPERLGRDVQHDDGILAAGEQQHRPFEGCCNLPEYVDRLRFEGVQVR